MQTLGDKINELTDKYTNLYDYLKENEIRPAHDLESYILLDLQLKVFVYEQAIENVKTYIRQGKTENSNDSQAR